ncbi:helix-turn-helix domain-containing protein [Methylobacterium sp. R2-1]|uniref:helix-turn-helix domain-containing protein n=1 Tax=Methylobacterium sp. R2-1 TaxID=2587064 RepID=UPI00161ABFEF|nr:helix-turn-helix transcriptional regulator [Methylobacterium sp. R2-1]MBB2964668.1 transcriptional regulator with XRE-family HTH domain [Methylobacterium sp. R2-1]
MTPDDFKAWRLALGFSQQEAADRLGVSRGSVENYERGHRREDHRPVEIPLPIERSCQAVALEEADKRGDVKLLTGELKARVLRMSELLRERKVKA